MDVLRYAHDFYDLLQTVCSIVTQSSYMIKFFLFSRIVLYCMAQPFRYLLLKEKMFIFIFLYGAEDKWVVKCVNF